MDSLEGFSPEDTSGFIAIQGKIFTKLFPRKRVLTSK